MFLAIDYGTKRIGFAIGSQIPRGAGVLDSAKGDEVLAAIKRITDKEEIEKIIIGLPVRSQGEEGTIAPEIREFAGKVQRATGLKIVFEPEQFTSAEAESLLIESGKKFDRSSGKVDELAAVLILEQYIHSLESQPS